MEEYKSNSHKYRNSQQELINSDKKVDKVVTGVVKTQKKSEMKKLADAFISEDANNVTSYIFADVLVPAIKKTISDIITIGVDILLYGEAGRTKKSSTASKVSYRNFYEKENERRREYNSVGLKSGYSYDDIVLDNRGEAEDVIARMEEIISKYGLVSVADLYDLVGITGNYTDNKYGWTDIRNATVLRVRDGYLIKLPKALPLNL